MNFSKNEIDEAFSGFPTDCTIALAIEARAYGYGAGIMVYDHNQDSFIFGESSSSCVDCVQLEQYDFDSQGYGHCVSLWAFDTNLEEDGSAKQFVYGGQDYIDGKITLYDDKEATFVVLPKDEMLAFLLSFTGENGYDKLVFSLSGKKGD